jgi:ankyrin repeat protein
VIGLLLRNGAKVDARSNYGFTPLQVAVAAGRLEVAEVLLEAGADLEATNKAGLSVLNLASPFQRKKLLECLSTLGRAKDHVIPKASPRATNTAPMGKLLRHIGPASGWMVKADPFPFLMMGRT